MAREFKRYSCADLSKGRGLTHFILSQMDLFDVLEIDNYSYLRRVHGGYTITEMTVEFETAPHNMTTIFVPLTPSDYQSDD